MSAVLSKWDILALVAYFVILLAVYVVSLTRSERSSTEGYFLAGRNMNWFLIGMSLFSTNIGAEHFLGLAGSGASKGISAAAFEIHAMLIMQLLSWVFAPVLVSSGVQTMPQYFSARLGGQRIRTLLAVVYILLYIVTKVSVNIYAGALFVETAFKWNIYLAILLVLSMTALFAVGGGLASVMYTDTCMTAIMLTGGTILCVLAFKHIGYMPGLYKQYMKSVTNFTTQLNLTEPDNPLVQCAVPQKKAFQILHGIKDPDVPWLGFFIGHTPNTIWYWCSDQMMVQRVMSAKSAAHARGGTLLTGFLKITPLFLMVFVGMISRASFVEIVGCPGSNCSNRAYPTIAMELLPSGLKGLHLAVMISALISGLTSLFNSSSTLFTLDIYRLIRKKAPTYELMIVGRAFALLVIILAIAWIPLVIKMNGTDIYIYIQSINSFFAAPIACIYVLAVFWDGLSEKGAFWALASGFTLGITRMILEFARPAQACGQGGKRFKVVEAVNFMYFAAINFFVTALVAVFVSRLTIKPPAAVIDGKTYQTRRTKETRAPKDDAIPQPSGITQPPEEPLEFATEKPSTPRGWSHRPSKWLLKALSFICGIDFFQKSIKPRPDAEQEYQVILDKFSESNISKPVKMLLYSMVFLLTVSTISCYIVLSLDPDITFAARE